MELEEKEQSLVELENEVSNLTRMCRVKEREIELFEEMIKEGKTEIQKQNAEWLGIKDVSSLSMVEKSLLNFQYHLHY